MAGHGGGGGHCPLLCLLYPLPSGAALPSLPCSLGPAVTPHCLALIMEVFIFSTFSPRSGLRHMHRARLPQGEADIAKNNGID